ncbi:hypothetical protein O181_091659 [Austropuccinia psidii MF-1]|uniref:C2H2-type domain-containing protein n=1 Tax=Austropuccinia psidii MF-1 TaxID=1389203 RepID=A0A9Q3P846_9BASI|nr:hypothetical protein [Austropuccinia psidii MF-1]
MLQHCTLSLAPSTQRSTFLLLHKRPMLVNIFKNLPHALRVGSHFMQDINVSEPLSMRSCFETGLDFPMIINAPTTSLIVTDLNYSMIQSITFPQATDTSKPKGDNSECLLLSKDVDMAFQSPGKIGHDSQNTKAEMIPAFKFINSSSLSQDQKTVSPKEAFLDYDHVFTKLEGEAARRKSFRQPTTLTTNFQENQQVTQFRRPAASCFQNIKTNNGIAHSTLSTSAKLQVIMHAKETTLNGMSFRQQRTKCNTTSLNLNLPPQCVPKNAIRWPSSPVSYSCNPLRRFSSNDNEKLGLHALDDGSQFLESNCASRAKNPTYPVLPPHASKSTQRLYKTRQGVEETYSAFKIPSTPEWEEEFSSSSDDVSGIGDFELVSQTSQDILISSGNLNHKTCNNSQFLNKMNSSISQSSNFSGKISNLEAYFPSLSGDTPSLLASRTEVFVEDFNDACSQQSPCTLLCDSSSRNAHLLKVDPGSLSETLRYFTSLESPGSGPGGPLSYDEKNSKNNQSDPSRHKRISVAEQIHSFCQRQEYYINEPKTNFGEDTGKMRDLVTKAINEFEVNNFSKLNLQLPSSLPQPQGQEASLHTKNALSKEVLASNSASVTLKFRRMARKTGSTCSTKSSGALCHLRNRGRFLGRNFINLVQPSASIRKFSDSIKCGYVDKNTGQKCQTLFKRSYDLVRHKETIHDCKGPEGSRMPQWTCEECGGAFSRKDALIR